MNIFKKIFKNVGQSARYKMIVETGNGLYAWNGKLYQSDIVRACIKPRAKAVGKLIAKHIRIAENNGQRKIETNPLPYIRFLLEEPNPYMTCQVMQEKIANQLALNNNAFVLIMRDDFGMPCELYPIPCTSAECIYKNGELYLKFYFLNGKNLTAPYTEIIHLRDDFCNNDIFGDNPAEALTSLMNVVSILDQGLIRAIKNSGVIRWLLKYAAPMRPEDLKKNVKNFADTYLNIESDTFGAAGVDGKIADAERIEPKDYVPNAALIDRQTERIYSFFNTNRKIVNSEYTENDWISYYESVVEPVAVQMANEYTRKLFSRRERGCGNKIIFESSNLTYASMQTKLSLVSFVDRGIMTPNEVREILNYAPIDGGDVPLLRKDTGTLGGE